MLPGILDSFTHLEQARIILLPLQGMISFGVFIWLIRRLINRLYVALFPDQYKITVMKRDW